MKKIDLTYETLVKLYNQKNKGITAEEIADQINIQRSNASSYLNILCKDNKAQKLNTRPVVFKPVMTNNLTAFNYDTKNVFNIIGYDKSLKISIEQAKAAIMYPPNGLNTIILGPTGVGKSMFANLMYKYAVEMKKLSADAPFITFNCADYANNPQLLMSELFGVEKGAYTGAEKAKDGLLKNADRGILFLDEVHRLPPEGQEMLFTFIDKGVFRKLGSTEKIISAKVRIIAATTEEPKSSLLDTFIRRIPMTIKLPPLAERTLKERYELINYFFSVESRRINKNIYVESDVIKALLVYECKNNIGQLKSDIKIGCARSFLDYIGKNKEKLNVKLQYFNSNVKYGLLDIKDSREKISSILKNLNYIEFVPDLPKTNKSEKNNFYNSIQEKLNNLKDMGIDIKEVNEIIDDDINNHFNTYINQFDNEIDYNEIKNIVGEDIFDIVSEISELVKKELGRSFSNQLFIGLGMHIRNFITKIKEGIKITNPQLNNIRIKWPKEFKVAVTIIQIIEKHFNIQVPLEEIGFITLFLKEENFKEENFENTQIVKIIVCLHGDTTASSMAKFVNELLKRDVVEAVDMPMNMTPKDAYEKIKKIAVKSNRCKGILLMVDMGSLTTFSDKIKEAANVEVKTVEMVSTPMVLEAAQKSLMRFDLNQIFNFTVDVNPYIGKKIVNDRSLETDKNLIIISCFAGENISAKLKSTIYKNINIDNYKTEILPMVSIDEGEYTETILNLKKHRNIIAVIGSIDPEIENIPFINYKKIFTEDGIEQLANVIKIENLYYEISISLKTQLINVDSEELIKDLRLLINNVTGKLKIDKKPELIVGWILHLCFMIDQTISGSRNSILKNKSIVKERYGSQYKIIKNEMKFLEQKYNISISDDEICALVIMMLEIEDL